MCGIIGWAGKTVKKFNKSKLDILGIYNESRGTDSCGVTTDGQIYIGINKQKVFKDFVSSTGYKTPLLVPTVIGHTRNSSRGTVNEYNAHPFGFDLKNENDGFNFIGVHNGTLLNPDELAEKFKVEKTQKTLNNSVRHKIDSEILLECIYKSKSFKVLQHYVGTAAIVFTNTNEPNKIYCYHGASKKEKDATDGKIYEERPLYYWKETKNSLYISSIEESLIAIGGNEKTIGKFDYNVVYEITDGDISNAVITKINRKNCYQNKFYPTYSNSNSSKFNFNDNYDDIYDNIPFVGQQALQLPSSKSSKDLNPDNIYNDTSNYVDGRIKVKRLRYTRNGHEITGIFTYIRRYGFYLLGQDLKNSEQTFNFLTGKEFFQGDFVKVEQNINNPNKYIPFPLKEVQSKGNIEEYFYYIVDGIRVRTASDYNACISRKKDKIPFGYSEMSLCSCHPVIDINVKTKGDDSQGILWNGVLYSGNYSMLGSDKIYEIVNGNCRKIKAIPEVRLKYMSKIHEYSEKMKLIIDETDENTEDIKAEVVETVIQDVDTLQQVSKLLADNEIIESSRAINDLLDKDLNEMLLPSYKNFPSYIKRLQKYNDVPEAKKAIKVLEDFISKANEIIAIEFND